jgi:hypothetical protein
MRWDLEQAKKACVKLWSRSESDHDEPNGNRTLEAEDCFRLLITVIEVHAANPRIVVVPAVHLIDLARNHTKLESPL